MIGTKAAAAAAVGTAYRRGALLAAPRPRRCRCSRGCCAFSSSSSFLAAAAAGAKKTKTATAKESTGAGRRFRRPRPRAPPPSGQAAAPSRRGVVKILGLRGASARHEAESEDLKGRVGDVGDSSASANASANATAASVRTYRKVRVGIDKDGEGQDGGDLVVPMSVVDGHLRHEQLPFAYFFDGFLDEDELEASLRRVLPRFPVLAGRITSTDIRVSRNGVGAAEVAASEASGVEVTFAETRVPLERWLEGGPTYGSGSGHPTLSPLFEPLFEPGSSQSQNHQQQRNSAAADDPPPPPPPPPLATIKVTYLAGSGGGGGDDDITTTNGNGSSAEASTCIGINLNHAVADAASCFRFVSCWGREMRQGIGAGVGGSRSPFIIAADSNARSEATVAGMLTADLADAMGMAPPVGGGGDGATTTTTRWLDWMASCFGVEAPNNDKAAAPLQVPPEAIGHEYVRLKFRPEDLASLKAHGMDSVMAVASSRAEAESKSSSQRSSINGNSSGDKDLTFVSTNDMVSAFGWMLKRHLSGNGDWNLSVVVNLRGQGGVDAFSTADSSHNSHNNNNNAPGNDGSAIQHSARQGVFGNGITHVVAALPEMATSAAPSMSTSRLDAVSAAARSIRRALAGHAETVASRVTASRMGRIELAPTSLAGGGPSFSTTSWGQFPLWEDIGFVGGSGYDNNKKLGGSASSGNSGLRAFRGYPSHPLPAETETYSSIIVPTRDGGCAFVLLLPSSKAGAARNLHGEWLASFREWHNDDSSSSSSSSTNM